MPRIERVRELLDGGDWACSHGQCGTLGHVCRQLAELLDDTERAEDAREIADAVGSDPCLAAHRWAELSQRLRYPEPRPHSGAR